MSESSTICVLNFSGKKEDWPTWNEKFLVKANQSGLKGALLGKVLIPKTQDPVDKRTKERKEKIQIIHLNEMALTELILSIDAASSAGKMLHWLSRS
jgi:hypothetical protein